MKKKSIIIENIFYDLVHTVFTGGIASNYGYDKIPRYGIDFIEYMKEILLGKEITFQSVDKQKNNPYLTGLVIDVKMFEYKPLEEYVMVKLKGDTSTYYMINGNKPLVIYDYKPGPLHKELKMKKAAKKYNL